MANKKLNYVKQSRIKAELDLCDYLLILGERSNGKSYASKNLIISECVNNKDTEFIYLRRYDLDTKDSLCVGYFGDVPVESLTGGQYTCIDVFRKGIYLANINEDTGKVERGRKIGTCHALSHAEHYKSLSFPKVKYIIYEEIISRDGRYLYNEPDAIQQYISTIYRNHKGKVIMIGNTISRICPYYRNWGLYNIKKQIMGTVDEYRFNNENGEDTKLRVYLTDSLNYNSGMFFGKIAKNITGGAYEVDTYPHLPKRVNEYQKIHEMVVEVNEFKFLMSLLEDKKNHDVFWYVEPKTSEIQKNTRVISNHFSTDPLYTASFALPINDMEARAFRLIKAGKICYSDDLCGTEFNNVLTEVR